MVAGGTERLCERSARLMARGGGRWVVCGWCSIKCEAMRVRVVCRLSAAVFAYFKHGDDANNSLQYVRNYII